MRAGMCCLSAFAIACTGSPPSSDRQALPAPPPPPAAWNVDVAAERFVSRERLTGPEEELGTRVEVRSLPVPEIRRGSTTFTFDDGRQGWVAALPERNLLVTPAYADGKVFVGGGFASTNMYAFDAASGRPIWTAVASDGGPSAAIIDGDRVIF